MDLTRLTTHAQRVRDFMTKARQDLPAMPMIPTDQVRILRAKLMFEEVMETIAALGVEIRMNPEDQMQVDGAAVLSADGHKFVISGPMNLVEVADGCADVSVVTTGTLLACGIADDPLLELVDRNNLEKFGVGHSWNAAGKLIKPPGHKKPDIAAELERQRLSA